MSFRFRRRGDVNEQSPQQEPFFQNTAGQQPYVDGSTYPQMGQHQGLDPRFSNGFGPQPYPQQPYGMNPGVPMQPQTQPFFNGNNENFYNPQQQQPMLNTAPNQPYGMMPPQMHPQAPNAYMHPVQASQLGNYQNYQQPQGQQAQLGQQAPHGQNPGYTPEDVRSLSFWQESQANAGFEDPERDSEANSPIRLLVAVAGVALIAGLSWFAYKWAKSPSSDTPPLIHADQGPHKVSPDHRGGLNIPYQDKLIYDRIGDNVNEEPAERLLPPPEMPSDMSQQPIDQNQQMVQQQPMQTDGQQHMQQPMQQGQMPQQAIAPQQMNTQPQQQQPTAVAPMPAVSATAPTQPQAEEIEPEIIKKPKPEVTIKGTYFVQMATVKSEEAALREWKRLQAKHSLKGMKSQIKESETTDGDTVFRLLMGPFEEKIKAQKYAVKIDGTKVVHITE